MNTSVLISAPASRRVWATSFGLCCILGCGRAPEEPSAPSAPDTSRQPAPIYKDVAQRANLDFMHQLANGKLDNIMKSDGAGGALLDYDKDGWVDIYLVNSGPVPGLSEAPPGTPRRPNRLYRNQRDGTFTEVTQQAGVEGWGFGTTAAAADYDNDGDRDLLVVNFGGLILYRNQGDGTFKDVTTSAGLRARQAGISAVFLDADGDGWLDLFVANYLVFDPEIQLPPGSSVPYPGPLSYPPELNILYRNRGDGTFEDVSERSGVRIPGHRAMSVTALDYNMDGSEDLYVSNDATPNLLLANNGKGVFKDVAWQCGVAVNQFGEAAGSMGAAAGDCSGDALPDLLVTRFGNASLYLSHPGGFFEDRVGDSGILKASAHYVGWGGAFLDFDNDGDLDVFIANGDPHSLAGAPSLLLENSGNASFENAAAKAGPFFARRVNLRGCGVFDLDNDGRLDVLLTSLGGPAFLLRNQSSAPGHWLTLSLVGTRCNRDAFGAIVKLTAGPRVFHAEVRCPTSYLFQHDSRLHFGLGSAARVDRIEIRWPKPSGQVQVLADIGADQILEILEP